MGHSLLGTYCLMRQEIQGRQATRSNVALTDAIEDPVLLANIFAIFSNEPFVLILGASWFQNNCQSSGIASLFHVRRRGRD